MKNILVITDTVWSEAEVSQKSASFVVEELEKVWHAVKQVFWDPDYGVFDKDLVDIDLALPIVHGKFWEDGQITDFLQKRGVATLFSDAKVHRLCLDKYGTKKVLQGESFPYEKYEIKFPWSVVVNKAWQNVTIPDVVSEIFVKPNSGGSSVDSWIFENITDAQNLIAKILDYDEVLVEEYIEQPRELTVAISWDYNKEVEILGIMEVLTEREFFDYKAKYEWAETQEIFPDLDLEFRNYLKNISLQIYKKLQIKTFGRIDFLLKDKVLYFLEINTIPWMTANSFFPQCVAHAGYESFWKYLQQFIG